MRGVLQMITKITSWIEGKMETGTDSEQSLLLELTYFIIAQIEKEIAEKREALDELSNNDKHTRQY